MIPKMNDNYLENTLAKIEQVRNWSPRVISKLENLVRSGRDEDLFRVNPIQWAQEKSVEENEAIELFLHSAKAGLFYMDWMVICPCCGKIMQSFTNLHSLQSRNTCTVCFRDDQATLDDYVQIAFTVSPAVRPLIFDQPENLSLEDYSFKYLFARNARFDAELKMTAEDLFVGFGKHHSRFAPGESVTIVSEGDMPRLFGCNDLFTEKGFALLLDGAPTTEIQKVAVRLTDDDFEVPLPKMDPGEIKIAQKLYKSTFYQLRPGKVEVELLQESGATTILLATDFPLQVIAAKPDIQFLPAVTAKRLFASQTFHNLFRAEVFQESEGFGIKDVIILFTDLKSSTQLYQKIGDLNAFALVREHYGVLNTAILNQHGTIVKTIGDAIMATFNQPVDAVAAGLEMLGELRRLNEASHYANLILKIGIHRGTAISVTLNERIDYFGQTVNIAARIQGSAGGDEIYLSEEIYSASGVADLLQKFNCNVESFPLELKGIEGQVKSYKVTSPN